MTYRTAKEQWLYDMQDDKKRHAEIKKLKELLAKSYADLAEMNNLSAYDIDCITDEITEYQEMLDDCKLLTEEHFAKWTVSDLRWAIHKVNRFTYNHRRIKRLDGTTVPFDKARKAELKSWLLTDDSRPKIVGQLTYSFNDSDVGREEAKRLRGIGTIENIQKTDMSCCHSIPKF